MGNIKTPIKRQQNRVMGVKDGVSFTTENQPSPEQKKLGWQKIREQRHLTQSILKEMLGNDGIPTESFKGFMQSLVINAKTGNPKAIDIISKCIEDDIQKVQQTNINYNIEMSKEEMKKINKQLEEDY